MPLPSSVGVTVISKRASGSRTAQETVRAVGLTTKACKRGVFPFALSFAGIARIGDTPAAFGCGAVLGMEDGLISRQLFASPEVDATLDDDHSGIPFHYFRASAFLVRLDQEEDFAADLAEWYDEKLFGEAGRAATGKGGHAYSFPGTPLSGLSEE